MGSKERWLVLVLLDRSVDRFEACLGLVIGERRHSVMVSTEDGLLEIDKNKVTFLRKVGGQFASLEELLAQESNVLVPIVVELAVELYGAENDLCPTDQEFNDHVRRQTEICFAVPE